jgi:ATP-dependent Clp protease ATP-binding subunit ClpC
MTLESIATTLLVGIVIGYLLPRIKARFRQPPAAPDAAPPTEASDGTARLYELARETQNYFESTAHPKDLLDHPTFQEGVRMLSSGAYTDGQLLEYYAGGNVLIGCMALEALRSRVPTEEIVDQLIFHIGRQYIWSLYFAFRVLGGDAPKPVVGAALLKAPDWWEDEELLQQILKAFIDQRLEKGEQPTFGPLLAECRQEQLNQASDLIGVLGHSGLKPLEAEIQQRLQTQVDRNFLNSVGRLWDPLPPAPSLSVNEAMERTLRRLEKTLTAGTGRSVILTGEAGVGKTTHVRALARRLASGGLLIFEASAADIIAGQTYIGELEDRLRKITGNLDRKRGVIWFVPSFQELLFVGRHRYNPAGILDMLMPYIESGRITLVGETRPAAFEQLTRDNPRIKTAFDILQIDPLNDGETLALAGKWAALNVPEEGGAPLLAGETLKEALQMVRQFLGNYSAPGNLLDFLKLTLRHSTLDGRAVQALRVDDLYLTLSQVTGLPRTILDDRQGLDIQALRDLFLQRVMGQTEAVDCLVERIAMMKAGLTDPSRPLGVFLFAGPTGTGKTEIAKTLAEFLFGSPERMIRLDMSEFKTAGSEGRILGEADQTQAPGALVNQIRKQPFSVVLLDEFEKAHANIWDLFLQVFDDGRLTDRQGNTADFRHAMIILTSNLGATIRPGSGIGFSPDTCSFSMHQVEKAIGRTFRREFINRLDRVVVFHPLSRSVMREILFKELDHVLQRRGLRNRDWAVEWEESAIAFLLEKGFTPDLGARPLKRAIEQYLLAPLAITIVNHQHPEGDQFLFVRSDSNSIEVEFIDPDAPAPPAEATPAAPPAEPEEIAAAHGLKKLMLAPEGTAEEVELLAEGLDALRASIQSEEWQKRKQEALQRIAAAGFWQSADCYPVLGRTEFMDRTEAALRTADSLSRRLRGSGDKPKASYSRKIITRLAEQIYLLAEADKSLVRNLPKDAYLMIESRGARAQGNEAAGPFMDQLLNMYRQWARKRRMRHILLQNPDPARSPALPVILALSGLGSYAVLEPEAGLHVLEIPKGANAYDRINVRVGVVGQPDAPVHTQEDHLKQAAERFAGSEASPVVVRRYRWEPSPLVRDAIRNYRTGRIDKVMDGDFDLFG